MATCLVLMGTPNYRVMPREKAKVSLHSNFYRQGFWLDDVCGVITLHMPSTGNSVMTHLTSCPGQCLFASTNWHQPSAWKGTVTSGLDYECTGKSQCKKVMGHFTITHTTEETPSTTTMKPLHNLQANRPYTQPTHQSQRKELNLVQQCHLNKCHSKHCNHKQTLFVGPTDKY